MRNPPSIASLPGCLRCVLISHGLSRPTFRVFCTDQGSAAWPCPGCMDRLPRAQGGVASFAIPPSPCAPIHESGLEAARCPRVRCRMRQLGLPAVHHPARCPGAAGIPVAPHLPVATRQFPKEAGVLAACLWVLHWEGMVLARWEEHCLPAFPSLLTACLGFVWQSCSLSCCVTGVLRSWLTQPAPQR